MCYYYYCAGTDRHRGNGLLSHPMHLLSARLDLRTVPVVLVFIHWQRYDLHVPLAMLAPFCGQCRTNLHCYVPLVSYRRLPMSLPASAVLSVPTLIVRFSLRLSAFGLVIYRDVRSSVLLPDVFLPRHRNTPLLSSRCRMVLAWHVDAILGRSFVVCTLLNTCRRLGQTCELMSLLPSSSASPGVGQLLGTSPYWPMITRS